MITERPAPTLRFTDIVYKQVLRSVSDPIPSQLHLALIFDPSDLVNFSMYYAVNLRYLQRHAPSRVKRDTMINRR